MYKELRTCRHEGGSLIPAPDRGAQHFGPWRLSQGLVGSTRW